MSWANFADHHAECLDDEARGRRSSRGSTVAAACRDTGTQAREAAITMTLQ
jgi:hypothetical protein